MNEEHEQEYDVMAELQKIKVAYEQAEKEDGMIATEREIRRNGMTAEKESASRAVKQAAAICGRAGFPEDDITFFKELAATMGAFLECGETMDALWCLIAMIVAFQDKGVSEDDLDPLTDLQDELMRSMGGAL